MLVLSRKKGESIKINDDITITVVEIRGDKIRLGIIAPKGVPVHRKEVYEAILAAAKAVPITPAQELITPPSKNGATKKVVRRKSAERD
jgi:carbon storage regulator